MQKVSSGDHPNNSPGGFLNHPASSHKRNPPGFTCDELDHFYRVFQRFDRDSSDTMCASEFSNALTWLGFPYGPEKLQVQQRGKWDRLGKWPDAPILRDHFFVVVFFFEWKVG